MQTQGQSGQGLHCMPFDTRLLTLKSLKSRQNFKRCLSKLYHIEDSKTIDPDVVARYEPYLMELQVRRGTENN